MPLRALRIGVQLAVHVDMPAQMTHAYTALALPPAPAPAVTYWYVGWSSSPVAARPKPALQRCRLVMLPTPPLTNTPRCLWTSARTPAPTPAPTPADRHLLQPAPASLLQHRARLRLRRPWRRGVRGCLLLGPVARERGGLLPGRLQSRATWSEASGLALTPQSWGAARTRGLRVSARRTTQRAAGTTMCPRAAE